MGPVLEVDMAIMRVDHLLAAAAFQVVSETVIERRRRVCDVRSFKDPSCVNKFRSEKHSTIPTACRRPHTLEVGDISRQERRG